jgi:hypothetical protein
VPESRENTANFSVLTFTQFNFQIGRMLSLLANFHAIDPRETFCQMNTAF